MLVVVSDAANLSSARLTAEEKTSMADTWARILFDIIPENRLLDALDRAVLDHQTSFAINGYDLKLAYGKLHTEELAGAQRQIDFDRRRDPVLFCENSSRHLNGAGDVKYFSAGANADESAPCPICRKTDFESWKRTQIALYGEHAPLTKPANYAAQQNPGYVSDKDPAAILNRLKNEISAEMVAALGTHRYEDLRGGWKTVVGALNYLAETGKR